MNTLLLIAGVIVGFFAGRYSMRDQAEHAVTVFCQALTEELGEDTVLDALDRLAEEEEED